MGHLERWVLHGPGRVPARARENPGRQTEVGVSGLVLAQTGVRGRI